jgi:hypothetical protein
MTGYTNPDRLPYPDDPQRPADSPTALHELAATVQAALLTRDTAISQRPTVPLVVGPIKNMWDGLDYVPLTQVEPAAQRVGDWAALQDRGPGLWLIWMTAYLDVTGAPTAGQGAMLAMSLQWLEGSAPATIAGDGAAFVGRLTAPAGQRIVAAVQAMVVVPQIPGRHLLVAPQGNKLSDPVGGAASLGKPRMTALWLPSAATIPLEGIFP